MITDVLKALGDCFPTWLGATLILVVGLVTSRLALRVYDRRVEVKKAEKAKKRSEEKLKNVQRYQAARKPPPPRV